MLTCEFLLATHPRTHADLLDWTCQDLIVDRIVGLQDDKATFEQRLGDLMRGACYSEAGLSEATLKEVMTIDILTQLPTLDVSRLVAEWSMPDLCAAIDMVADKEKIVANSLDICPPGRALVKKAKDKLDAVTASNSRLQKLAKSVSELLAIWGKDAKGDAEMDISQLPIAYEALAKACANLEPCDMTRNDTILTDAQSSFELAGEAHVRSFLRWARDIILSFKEHVTWPGGLVRVAVAAISALTSFASSRNVAKVFQGGAVILSGFYDAIDQALALLDSMPQIADILKKVDDSKALSFSEAGLLQRSLGCFQVHPKWLEALGSANDSDNAPGDTDFSEALRESWLSADVRKTIADSITKDQEVNGLLRAFLKAIPKEFEKSEMPPSYKPLGDVVRLRNVIEEIADSKLKQQFDFIKIIHEVGETIAKLEDARKGTNPEFSRENVDMFVMARSTEVTLKAELARPSLSQCFLAETKSGGIFHIDILDNVLEPDKLSRAALAKLEAEMRLWRTHWLSVVQGLGVELCSLCPEGWQAALRHTMSIYSRPPENTFAPLQERCNIEPLL